MLRRRTFRLHNIRHAPPDLWPPIRVRKSSLTRQKSKWHREWTHFPGEANSIIGSAGKEKNLCKTKIYEMSIKWVAVPGIWEQAFTLTWEKSYKMPNEIHNKRARESCICFQAGFVCCVLALLNKWMPTEASRNERKVRRCQAETDKHNPFQDGEHGSEILVGFMSMKSNEAPLWSAQMLSYVVFVLVFPYIDHKPFQQWNNSLSVDKPDVRPDVSLRWEWISPECYSSDNTPLAAVSCRYFISKKSSNSFCYVW